MNKQDRGEISTLAAWFDTLSIKAQRDTMSFLTGELNDLDFTEEDQNNLSGLIKAVVYLSLEHSPGTSSPKEALLGAGFDKIVSEALLSFVEPQVKRHRDARKLSALPPELVERLAHFVVESMLLFQDYKEMSPEEACAALGIDDVDTFTSVIGFLYHHYRMVCHREISPRALSRKLTHEYGLSETQQEIAIKPLHDQWAELQQACLMSQLNHLLEELSSVACTLEGATGKT